VTLTQPIGERRNFKKEANHSQISSFPYVIAPVSANQKKRGLDSSVELRELSQSQSQSPQIVGVDRQFFVTIFRTATKSEMSMLQAKKIVAQALAIFLGCAHVQAFTVIGDSRARTSPMATELIMVTKTSFAGDHVSDVHEKMLDAETSASLYLDPVTQKLGDVTISWEPETAMKIRDTILEKRLEQRMKALEIDGADTQRKPFMVGVVGIPGSGKSTSAEILSALLSNSIVMPLDGYHIPMAELGELPNAKDVIYRRGAPDTFDPASLEKALERIVNGDEAQVSIPGFDHAKGDPEKDQHIFVRDEHSIVVCEGIYLMHQGDGWENIKSFFDYIIYIEIGVDTCVARLKERNKCIPGYTPEEIEIRCEVVDRANAETVEKSRIYASELVQSGAT
jgi:pantothenate kinase